MLNIDENMFFKNIKLNLEYLLKNSDFSLSYSDNLYVVTKHINIPLCYLSTITNKEIESLNNYLKSLDLNVKISIWNTHEYVLNICINDIYTYISYKYTLLITYNIITNIYPQYKTISPLCINIDLTISSSLPSLPSSSLPLEDAYICINRNNYKAPKFSLKDRYETYIKDTEENIICINNIHNVYSNDKDNIKLCNALLVKFIDGYYLFDMENNTRVFNLYRDFYNFIKETNKENEIQPPIWNHKEYSVKYLIFLMQSFVYNCDDIIAKYLSNDALVNGKPHVFNNDALINAELKAEYFDILGGKEEYIKLLNL